MLSGPLTISTCITYIKYVTVNTLIGNKTYENLVKATHPKSCSCNLILHFVGENGWMAAILFLKYTNVTFTNNSPTHSYTNIYASNTIII